MPDYTQINEWKRVQPFTVKNGLLTGNGKPRRNAITNQYQATGVARMTQIGAKSTLNTILVVEDDKLIGNAIEQWLAPNNRVCWARSIHQAQQFLTDREFDIVLLDIGLPDGNGLEILKTLKRRKHRSGVLILSAYGEIDSRIKGLDLGADDYLVKPIDFKELDARIRAIKRRKDGLNSTIIEHGDLKFDLNGMSVTVDDTPVHLSKKEVSILAVLMQGQNRYYSKTMLEERIYAMNTEIEGNAVEVHISSLRKKLGKSLIKTTRGLGYIIEKSAPS